KQKAAYEIFTWLEFRRVLFRSAGSMRGGTLRVTGKGNKARMVPVLPVVTEAVMEYERLCPYHLGADGPLFRGARGGPLQPAIIQDRKSSRRERVERLSCAGSGK